MFCIFGVYFLSDDIRDSSSDINTIQGAPDPTFGGSQGIRTQWQLSVDNLESNLVSDLKEMTRYRSYDYYRDT